MAEVGGAPRTALPAAAAAAAAAVSEDRDAEEEEGGGRAFEDAPVATPTPRVPSPGDNDEEEVVVEEEEEEGAPWPARPIGVPLAPDMSIADTTVTRDLLSSEVQPRYTNTRALKRPHPLTLEDPPHGLP